MVGADQLLTAYWKDKTARLERIKVPAYVVASWTNPVHTHGTLAGFRQIASRHKWLRVHNTQEWQDYYNPAHVTELRSFFDHFLRGRRSSWLKTPKVRLSVLDPGHTDTINRVESSFPLARTKFRRLHLTTAGELSRTSPGAESLVTCPVSGGISLAAFTYTFTQETELTGYMSLRTWVEALGNDDMELSVSVQKLGLDGKAYQAPGMVSWAATGALRVSQRRLDTARSTASEPLLAHRDEQRLAPGQIVPVDIGIWPMSMRYHAGEKLQLIIAAAQTETAMPDLGYGVTALKLPADGGTYRPGTKVATVTLGGSSALPAFVTAQRTTPPTSRNKGTHIFHVGGRFDSHLLIPEVPPLS